MLSYSAPYWLWRALVVSGLAIYSILACQFVWHDGLANFASDSSNYLLMAQYLSPWQESPEPVTSLWEFQYFPPLFPALLGLSGTAQHLALAHLFTLMLLLAALPLLNCFLAQLLNSRLQAGILLGLFLLSPATWLNILGILSENLYLLLSLIILHYGRQTQTRQWSTMWILGLALAALMATRTIGIAMLGAYLLSAIAQWRQRPLELSKALLPAIIGGSYFLISGWLQSASAPGFYLQQFDLSILGSQLLSLWEVWHTSLQFYWTDALPLPYFIVSILGALALGGMLLRILEQQLDAYYVLLYLGVLLIWPYPGQGLRFMFPVLPFLMGYALYCLCLITKKLPHLAPASGGLIGLFLLALVILPAQIFVFNRFQSGREFGYQHYYDFYNRSDLPDALRAAAIQQALYDDLSKVRDSTREHDLVLYFEPSLVALFAERMSLPLAQYINSAGQFDHAVSPPADFVYLSRIEPRNSSERVNGIAYQSLLEQQSVTLWEHHLPDTGETVGALLQLQPR